MSPNSKTILIAGYYGFGNAGDEAILSAIISDLRALRSDLNLVVVSGDPAQTEAAHGVAGVLWTDIEKIMQAVAASDLVILGGGGLFHDYWGFDPDSLLTQHHAGIAFFGGIPLLASLLDKPLMMYAVGVGPLFSAVGQAHTRAAFDAAALITVRDPESKALLESIGVPPDRVHVTADPGFQFQPHIIPLPLPFREGGRGDRSRPLLAVALREWNIGVLPDYWERQVAEALDVFVERHGGAIVFVPFQEGKGYLQNDAAVAERVRSGMRNIERTMMLPENSSVREKAAALSQCDLVLGMRLHSLIFAVSSAVPAVGLVYDPKVRSVMAAAGIEDYAVDLGAATAGRLAERMETAFAERGALSARLKESAGSLSESAQENARLAVALLDGAKPSPATPAMVDVLKGLALSQTRKRIEQEAQAQMLAAQSAERGQAIADLQAQSAERGQAVADLRVQRAQLEARADEHARTNAELQRQIQAE
ncbi:MAG: polysaccharide pyruvyl transferase family protein [Chloroflexota bacterium]